MTNKLRKRAKKIILITVALLAISIGLILCANSEILAILGIKEDKQQGQENLEIMALNEQTEINRKSAVSSISEINDLNDFIAFRDSVNAGNTYTGKTVYLNTDIDLSTVCSSTLGSWIPIGDNASNAELAFSGVFEGQGHSIDNIYIKKTTGTNQGLFGVIIGGQVKNLTMKNGTVYVNSVSANGQTGSIARIFN
ncbi:MAG: hypothetical protein HFJ50_06910 [Clostridia bacterium]|jgi:hypothetical protein|nr:hypothetical protein [Clostridia bacterium]